MIIESVAAAGMLFAQVVGDKTCIKDGLELDEVRLLVHTLSFLIEAVQGPCLQNQQVLATKTNMLEACSHLLDTRLERAREPYFIEPANTAIDSLLDSGTGAPWWGATGIQTHTRRPPPLCAAR